MRSVAVNALPYTVTMLGIGLKNAHRARGNIHMRSVVMKPYTAIFCIYLEYIAQAQFALKYRSSDRK